MRQRLADFSERVYQFLLQLYPPEFRERYTGEMTQVTRALFRDYYRKSGRLGGVRLWLALLWDGIGAVIYQWRIRMYRNKVVRMKTQIFEPKDTAQALSPLTAGLAALPFLLFGLSVMLVASGLSRFFDSQTPLWRLLLIHPYWIFYWLILIGLGAGLLRDFPRWSYSYLGWGMIMAAWSTNMRMYGHDFDWRVWLPLIGVVLAALIIRRSIQPLQNLMRGIGREWTLLSLGLYIFYGSVYMLFDENHHPLLLAFMAAATLGLTLGAWGYFRLTSPFSRISSLLAGLFLAVLLSEISYATWDYAAYYNLPASANAVNLIGLYFFLGMAGLMLATAFLAKRRPAQKV